MSLNTFDESKAERRAKRQAQIAQQLENMERSVDRADQSFRNFITNVDNTDDDEGSPSSAASAASAADSAAARIAAESISSPEDPDFSGSFRLPRSEQGFAARRRGSNRSLESQNSASDTDLEMSMSGSDHQLSRWTSKKDKALKFLNDEDSDGDDDLKPAPNATWGTKGGAAEPGKVPGATPSFITGLNDADPSPQGTAASSVWSKAGEVDKVLPPGANAGASFIIGLNDVEAPPSGSLASRFGRTRSANPEFSHADAGGAGDEPSSLLGKGRTMVKTARRRSSDIGWSRSSETSTGAGDEHDLKERLRIVHSDNLAPRNRTSSYDSLDLDDIVAAAATNTQMPQLNKNRSQTSIFDDDPTLYQKVEWALISAWNFAFCGSRSTQLTCLGGSGRRRTRVCVQIMVAAAAVVVALAVALRGWGPLSHLPKVVNPGGHGGASEVSVPPPDERIVKIRERIVSAGASEPSAPEGSDVPPTPQYLALEWLAAEDPMALDPDDPYLLQRYALAVVWFAMTYEDGALSEDSQWENRTNWMTGKGICIWHGVSCQHQHGTSSGGGRPHGTSSGDSIYDDNNGVTGLNLTANGLRGELPTEIYNILKDLTDIDVSNNAIIGTFSPEISKLVELERLNIGGNSIEGSIPTNVGKLTKLTKFYAFSNLLTGKIPEEIGSLVDLHVIGLHQNQLSGPITPALGRCQKLRNLYLDTNQLTSTIPDEIYTLSHLTDLRLSDNRLRGSISTDVDKLRNLEILYLDRNELTGTVPRTFGMLGNRLEELHLHLNELSGAPPEELGRLSGLRQLYLSSNKLEGTIPTEWAGMKDLQQLFIADNYIRGSIPPAIAGMEYLQALQAQSNRLAGPIPTEIGSMFRMEYIHLENNKLTGGVPEEMGQLLHLEKLTIHGNEMDGKVPEEVCKLVELAEFIADCAGDDAPVDCHCCSGCK